MTKPGLLFRGACMLFAVCLTGCGIHNPIADSKGTDAVKVSAVLREQEEDSDFGEAMGMAFEHEVDSETFAIELFTADGSVRAALPLQEGGGRLPEKGRGSLMAVSGRWDCCLR